MSSAGSPTVRLTWPFERWEYRVFRATSDGMNGMNIAVLEQYLNDAGQDGWELVSLSPELGQTFGTVSPAIQSELVGVLKRRIP